MIKNFFITGDTHGGFNTITRVNSIAQNNSELKPEETGIIILGDCSLNFYLNKTDKKYKKILNNMGYHIYCVRGNHEERPELIPGMVLVEDKNVNNVVWMQEEFPNIRYFVDGNEYNISGHSTLVVGGAYSVDKWYRLERAAFCGGHSGWFESEQLTEQEQKSILKRTNNKKFDLVFTHTCPFDWEPIDLFLGGINQATVDTSMEIWLNNLRNAIDWGIWCFGHFHSDRIERPHVQQFFTSYEPLDNIISRWQNYDKTGELDQQLPKSPYFNINPF